MLSTQRRTQDVASRDEKDIKVDIWRFELSRNPNSVVAFRGVSIGGHDLVEIEEASKVKILRLMLKGKYGTFYEGIWKQTPVSVNFQSLTQLRKHKLFTERNILALTQSSRVLQLFATCLDFEHFTANYITEHFKCSLRVCCREHVPLTTRARFMVQLTEGIQFIHEKDVVLREVNPDNIFILNSENLVISYFGRAGIAEKSTALCPDEDVSSSPEYSALEVLHLDKYTNQYHYSKYTDVFSMGCILFEMLTNTAFLACPRKLINEPVETFYSKVHQKGRPFTRMNTETDEVEFFVKNNKEREDLLKRIEENLLESTNLQLHESLIRLFNAVLICSGSCQISANEILESEAFKNLGLMFDTRDCVENPRPRVDITRKSQIIINHIDSVKIHNSALLRSMFGFSKLYKQIDSTVQDQTKHTRLNKTGTKSIEDMATKSDIETHKSQLHSKSFIENENCSNPNVMMDCTTLAPISTTNPNNENTGWNSAFATNQSNFYSNDINESGGWSIPEDLNLDILFDYSEVSDAIK